MSKIIHEQFEIDENNTLVKYHEKEDITDVVIPEGVTTIGWGAFNSCEKLNSITIPNSVTAIGSHAFPNCKSLKEITIPNSVTEIGEFAFAECISLMSVKIPNSVTKIGDGAFLSCKNLININIPDSVTAIGKFAFGHCTNLTSINIPYGVTEIEILMFAYCNSLTEITIPDSVTTIPDSATTIDYDAFCECNNIKTINIPSYDIFTKLNNYLKVVALNTIIKNKTKFSEEDVNKFGQYIVENKIEILKIIIQNNHLMNLLVFVLNDIYKLYTKEEIDSILDEMIKQGQNKNNVEITSRLLEYKDRNYNIESKNVEAMIDKEFDLGNFGDENYNGNTK